MGLFEPFQGRRIIGAQLVPPTQLDIGFNELGHKMIFFGYAQSSQEFQAGFVKTAHQLQGSPQFQIQHHKFSGYGRGGQGLFKISLGSSIRVNLLGGGAGPLQVFAFLKQVVTAAVMIGDGFQWNHAGLILLQVLRQQLVQPGAGRKNQAFISHFLGDDMFKEIGQFRVGNIQRRQIQARQFFKIDSQAGFIPQTRIKTMQPGKRENASDHTGHLERHLLQFGQLVYPA